MKLWKIAVVVLVLLLTGCSQSQESDASPDAGSSGSGGQPSAATPETTAEAAGTEIETVTIETSEDGNVRVRAEIADEANEMAFGLMARTELAEDAGMLFVYPDERQLSFWMKDTLIPLSIAFMDSKGGIVDIQDMKPLDDEPPHYVSAEPARYALEVSQGFFEERGVKVGDRARLPV